MIRDDILDLMAEDRQTSEEQYMIMIARKIKRYCTDKQNCDGCPFIYDRTRSCCLSEGYAPNNWIIKDYDPISFSVGDEIRIKGSNPELDDCDFAVVTHINKRYMHVIRSDGSGGDQSDFDKWEKTGRFFPEIGSLLHRMRLKYSDNLIYADTDSVKEDPDGT